MTTSVCGQWLVPPYPGSGDSMRTCRRPECRRPMNRPRTIALLRLQVRHDAEVIRRVHIPELHVQDVVVQNLPAETKVVTVEAFRPDGVERVFQGGTRGVFRSQPLLTTHAVCCVWLTEYKSLRRVRDIPCGNRPDPARPDDPAKPLARRTSQKSSASHGPRELVHTLIGGCGHPLSRSCVQDRGAPSAAVSRDCSPATRR